MSSIGITRAPRRAGGLALALLATELVDELVDGATSAAWPAIRADLALDYAQVGVLLTAPALVGNLLEPALFLAGDVADRRKLILGGGAVFTLALLLYAVSGSYAGLLLAFTLFSPASGAFVALSQATLMDLAPRRQAQNMARWTLAGSLGGVGGAALIAAAERLGIGWRSGFLVIGAISLGVLFGVARGTSATGRVRGSRSTPRPASSSPRSAQTPASPGIIATVPGMTRRALATSAGALARGAADAVRAVRRGAVLRWLVLLEASNLMLDILHGFLALYFVDVVGASPSQAALAVAAWIGFGLAGDALIIPLLERVDGIRYLRASAVLTAAGFAAFLLVPGFAPRIAIAAALGLLNSGWYAILQAELYGTMPGRSGTVLALGSVAGLLGALMPLGIGVAAERVGLPTAMWIMLAGPLALLVGLPRTSSSREHAGLPPSPA